MSQTRTRNAQLATELSSSPPTLSQVLRLTPEIGPQQQAQSAEQPEQEPLNQLARSDSAAGTGVEGIVTESAEQPTNQAGTSTLRANELESQAQQQQPPVLGRQRSGSSEGREDTQLTGVVWQPKRICVRPEGLSPAFTGSQQSRFFPRQTTDAPGNAQTTDGFQLPRGRLNEDQVSTEAVQVESSPVVLVHDPSGDAGEPPAHGQEEHPDYSDEDDDDFARPPIPPHSLAERAYARPTLHRASMSAASSIGDMSTDSSTATLKLDDVVAAADDIEAEESNTCIICYERWTHRGNHQLVSLKCGHLFGYSCIKRWIVRGPSGRGRQSGYNKDKAACPVCKQKAAVKDIRKLVATAITAVDGEKLESARAEIKQLQDKCAKLEGDASHYQFEYHRMFNEVQKLRNQLDEAVQQKQWILMEKENLEKHLTETLACRPASEPKPSLPHAVSMEESTLANGEKLAVRAASLGNIPARVDDSQLDFNIGDIDIDFGAAIPSSPGATDDDTRNAPTPLLHPHSRPQTQSFYLPRMRLAATVPIAKRSGDSARLLAFHPHEPVLYVSHSNAKTRKHTMVQINVHDPAAPPFFMQPLHSEEIRGAEVSPHISGVRYLLTASMDHTAALTSLGSGVGGSRSPPMVANRFKLGERGWSCAWDPIDPNVCYVGTAKGLVQMFDIRKPSLAVHVWDGPASGARLLRPAVNSNGKIITGCSPIHSIAVVPSSQCSRLLVANSLHVYSLPTPEFKLGLADSSAAKTSNEWIRLTDSEAHNNPCYSVSFDPRQSLAAASFRSPGGSSRRQETIHEMFDVEFGKDSQVSWNRRHQINVESWQSKMTRSTIFSYYAEPPYNRWQSLMCAGIERSRQVKVWDGSAAQAKELVSLSDVPATEYVVDIKGCQWGLSDTGNQKTTLATLTNSTVRLYDIR